MFKKKGRAKQAGKENLFWLEKYKPDDVYPDWDFTDDQRWKADREAIAPELDRAAAGLIRFVRGLLGQGVSPAIACAIAGISSTPTALLDSAWEAGAKKGLLETPGARAERAALDQVPMPPPRQRHDTVSALSMLDHSGRMDLLKKAAKVLKG